MNKNITITIAGSTCSGKTGTAAAIAKLLISKGAQVTVNDQDGTDAVFLALQDNRIDAYASDLNVTINTVNVARRCTLSELEK